VIRGVDGDGIGSEPAYCAKKAIRSHGGGAETHAHTRTQIVDARRVLRSRVTLRESGKGDKQS
jgi:hypothetical protein